MRKILLYGLLAAITGNAFAEPAITGASVTGTTIKFTVQLSEQLFSDYKVSEKLFSGYKVKIDLNNGKGLASMKCSATHPSKLNPSSVLSPVTPSSGTFANLTNLNCTLSSNTLPKGFDDASYSVGIYDSKGALQGETLDIPYRITTTLEVNAVPTASTFSYAKISNSGATLPATAKLGTGTTDWACTKDNQTGLIWEVKTTDGGLRDMNNAYTWYEPDASKNGGNAGYQNLGTCKGSQCDTYAFTKAVNAKGLCGKKDWRMPTIEELKGLLTTTLTFNQPLNYKFYIDATYFPNTNTWFWSSSPYADFSSYAWYVSFGYGYSDNDDKSGSNHVRLVRG
jgi:hypothetical protein